MGKFDLSSPLEHYFCFTFTKFWINSFQSQIWISDEIALLMMLNVVLTLMALNQPNYLKIKTMNRTLLDTLFNQVLSYKLPINPSFQPFSDKDRMGTHPTLIELNNQSDLSMKWAWKSESWVVTCWLSHIRREEGHKLIE